MYGISHNVDFASVEASAGGKVFVVDCLVPKASTNTSSWIFQEYLPESSTALMAKLK